MCGGRRQGLLLGRQLLRAVGQQHHRRLTVPVAVNTGGVLNGKTIIAISDGDVPLVCSGRREGLLLGLQLLRTVGQQQLHQLERSGRGEHCRAAGRQDGHRDQRRGASLVCGGRGSALRAGATTLRGSWVTTAPPTLQRAGGGGHRRSRWLARRSPSITAGSLHSCAVADGRAYCWGWNVYGQLGNNTPQNPACPVAVETSGVLAGQDDHRDQRRGLPYGGAGGGRPAAARPQSPVRAVNGQVSVSWTVPGDNGGSPILDYTVTAIPGGAGCTTSSTACVVSGLANGTAYTFTVTARNAIGTSAPSTPSAPVIPTAPPVPRSRRSTRRSRHRPRR